MISGRQEYADKVYAEFDRELWRTIMECLDRHSASVPEKFLASMEMGKALVILGCNFLGNVCLMDSTEALEKAKEVIAFFKEKATEARDGQTRIAKDTTR